jgi:cyclase
VKSKIAAGIFAVLLFQGTAWAQDAGIVRPLRAGLTIAHLDNANVIVSAGTDGLVVIDDHFENRAQALRSLISSFTDKKPVIVVNSHAHPDHVGGNALFAAEGALIVADEVTRARVSTDQVSGGSGRIIKALPEAARPRLVFAESLSLHVNDEDMNLVRFLNAHSESDTVVFFAKANVAYLGGLFAGGGFANVYSAEGMIAALDAILARIDSETLVVPWRGPVGNKAELQAWRDVLGEAQTIVSDLAVAGKTEAEIIAAAPLAALGQTFAPKANRDALIKQLYARLKPKAP